MFPILQIQGWQTVPVASVQPAMPVFINEILGNTATPIYKHVVSGCFRAVGTELSLYSRDWMTQKAKNTYHSLYKGKFATLDLELQIGYLMS